MNLAEPIGQVGIEACDEGDARGAAEPGGADSGDGQTEHEGEGRDDPADAHTRGHVAHRLHDSLEDADLVFADRHQQGQSRAEVERTGKNAAPSNRAGKSFARVFNFVAHDGSKFEADEAETDHAEGVENEARIRGNAEIGGGDGSSEAEPNNDAKRDQKAAGDECTEAAHVIDPLADAEADDVEGNENREKGEGRGEGKRLAVCEPGVRWTKNKNRNADEVQHDGGDVHHVVSPVAPAGEKTVKVAHECFSP